MEVELSGVLEGKMKDVGRVMGEQIVIELSKKYNFDVAEALDHLNLDVVVDKSEIKKVRNTKKISIPLPFCGKINETNCYAIRLNHGLYTQCTNIHSEENGSNPVCITCMRQLEKNSNKAPTYGYIRERIEKGEGFRDPKGKSAVNYGNIMEKLKISRNEAESEAEKQGLTIPEKQFDVKKSQRGRPKKDTTAVDTPSVSDDELHNQKRNGAVQRRINRL